MTIQIPKSVQHVLDVLAQFHYEAYVVGGCVRDSLLGKTPADWDVTTSALPHEILAAFRGQPADKVIETGLKHGTLTILTGGEHVEVTTFRIDGCYSDNRHPDNVQFTGSCLRIFVGVISLSTPWPTPLQMA